MDFVKAHGGTIDLVDGEFTGAHFRISLPMRSEPSRKLVLDENLRDPS